MLTSVAAGKRCVEEVTRLMKLWIQDTSLKSISLKAVHAIPAIPSPKLSKPSKTKDHLQALNRRIKLCDEGYIEVLFYKCITIQ